MASSTVFFHSQRSAAIACLFFIPIVFKSSSLSSPHLFVWSSSFSHSFHYSSCNLLWHSFVLRSFNMAIPALSEGFCRFCIIFPF
jgi:hypothetical protein